MKKILQRTLVWCMIAAMLSGVSAANAAFPSKDENSGTEDKAAVEEAVVSEDEEVVVVFEEIDIASKLDIQVNGKKFGSTKHIPTWDLFGTIAPESEYFGTIIHYPMYAVIEAMGGTATHKNGVYTIDMGNVKLVTSINSTDITLTYEDGTVEEITDSLLCLVRNPETSAVYIPDTWITEYFGWNIGFDFESAIVLIDPQVILENALAGKDFSLYTNAHNSFDYFTGRYCAADFVLGAQITAPDGNSLGIETVSYGIIDSETHIFDMSTWLALHLEEFDYEVEEEEKAMVEMLTTDGVILGLRGNPAEGKIYVLIDPVMLSSVAGMNLGLGDVEVWVEMPLDTFNKMDEYVDDSGFFRDMTTDSDFMDILKDEIYKLANMYIVNADDYDYISTLTEEYAALFSNENFVKDGNTYVSEYSKEYDNGYELVTITLTEDKNGEIYSMGYAQEYSSEQFGSIDLLVEQTIDGDFIYFKGVDDPKVNIELFMIGTILPTEEVISESTPGKNAVVIPLDAFLG